MKIPKMINSGVNFCPCCGTNLLAVGAALRLYNSPAPEATPSNGNGDEPHATTPVLTIEPAAPVRETPRALGKRINDLYKQGMKPAEIAEKLKMPRSKVVYYCWGDGVSNLNRVDDKAKPAPLTDNQKASIKLMKKQGLSVAKVSDKLGIPKSQVNYIWYYDTFNARKLQAAVKTGR